jgi:hypothetical protein
MITFVVTGRYISFGAVIKSQVYRNLASKNGNAGTNGQVYRKLELKMGFHLETVKFIET